MSLGARCVEHVEWIFKGGTFAYTELKAISKLRKDLQFNPGTFFVAVENAS